jgi:allantoate deiminase
MATQSSGHGTRQFNFEPPELCEKPNMPISSQRLANDLAAIAAATETPGQGASRPTFSDAWAKAVEYVVDAARACDCVVHADAAGNIHLRPSVHERAKSLWLSGSHLDSVPHGGDFDGVVGVLVPLEVLRAAHEDGREAPPVEVIIFAEEEGTTFGLGMIGSRAWVGTLAADQLAQLQNAAGQSYLEAGARHGVRPDCLANERIDSSRYHGFIEVHIEQGPAMWKRQEPVAIVTAIAGRRQYQVDVMGTANHAGSTKMADRRDALAAAAEMISAVEVLPAALDPCAVATVGCIECRPNAVNVIAEHVSFTIDFRAAADDILERGDAAIRAQLAAIARKRGVDAQIQRSESINATALSPDICRRLHASAERLGHSLRETISGALHDAAILAPEVPTAMLFVASRDGVSHNPAEYSRIDDIALAAQILYTAISGDDGEVA